MKVKDRTHKRRTILNAPIVYITGNLTEDDWNYFFYTWGGYRQDCLSFDEWILVKDTLTE